MATPINDLPTASTLTGAEELAANQSGNTVKLTAQSLADFVGFGLDGLTSQILVGGGIGNPPVWESATGTGNPVKSTSPTLVTPVLGAATATSLTLISDLAIADGGTGQSTAAAAFDALSPLTTAGDFLVYTTTNTRLPKGAALQALRMDVAGTAAEWAYIPGAGDALQALPLSQFAATTSAQLAGVMSDETGTGNLVFSNSPTLVTPNLGTPSALVATNATGTAGGLTSGITQALKSATTTVSVSAATAPSANQVLSATNSTTATWVTPNTSSLSTAVNGLLKGNGSSVVAAVADTDYTPVVMNSQGDIIIGGIGGVATKLSIGTANTLLHGGASNPTYSAVVEADMLLSANSTNDSTTVRHGFLPVLSGVSTQFLNGQGNFAIPSGLSITNSYSLTSFSGQTSVSVTHNFGTYPVVQVIDNTGAVLVPLTTINNTVNDFTVTFASSTTGSLIATVGSPQPQQVLVTASNYTILATDRIIKQTASGKTITLLTSVGNTGREFIINNASSGICTVNTTSSQTISNQLTQVLPTLSSMTVYSDGANWYII